MADESYESECNRAELLGLQAPDKTEWQSSNQSNKIDSNDISEVCTVHVYNICAIKYIRSTQDPLKCCACVVFIE